MASQWKSFEPSSNIQFVCTECLSSPGPANQQSQQSQPIQLNESLGVNSPNPKPKATTIALIMNEVTKLQEQFASFQSSNTEVIAKLNSIDTNAAEMKSITSEIKSNTEAVLVEVKQKSSKPVENDLIAFGSSPISSRPFRPALNHGKPSFASLFKEDGTPAKTSNAKTSIYQSAKRPRIEKQSQKPKMNLPSPKVGTNANPVGRLVAIPPKPAPKKTVEKPKFEKAVWISRLPPITTEDEVREYISTIKSAISPNFTVHKLVTKGRPLSELRFVSFKIAVNIDDFKILNDPSVWPSGVLVREFMESKPVTLGEFLPNNLNGENAQKPVEIPEKMETAPVSPNNQTETVVLVGS